MPRKQQFAIVKQIKPLPGEEEFSAQYAIDSYVLNLWQQSLGFVLFLSGILPSIDQQKPEERQYYIDVVVYAMPGVLACSLMILLLERLPSIAEKKRELFSAACNHLRNNIYDTGVILVFLRSITALIAESAQDSDDFSAKLNNWFSDDRVAARVALALSLVGLRSMIAAGLAYSERKHKTAHEETLLLSSDEQKWDGYARFRWFGRGTINFCKNYVFSTFCRDILQGFAVDLSLNSQRAIPFAIPAIVALFDLIPNHPFVNRYQIIPQLKKVTRFLDKFIVSAMLNGVLAFNVLMDALTVIAGSENIAIENITAMLFLYILGWLSLHSAEISYLAAELLYGNRALFYTQLKIWEVAGKFAEAMLGWTQIFSAHPYFLGIALPFAAIDSLSLLLEEQSLTRWQRSALSLAHGVNHGLCNAGLIALTFPSAQKSLLARGLMAGLTLPFFTITQLFPDNRPVSIANEISRPLRYGLLGAGSAVVIEFFSNRLVPDYARYLLLGVPAALTLSFQLQSYWAFWQLKKLPNPPITSNDIQRSGNNLSLSSTSSGNLVPPKTYNSETNNSFLFFRQQRSARFAPLLENFAAPLIFTIATAALYQAGTTANSAADTSERLGLTVLKTLVGFVALVMMLSLVRNRFYGITSKNSANEIIKPKILDPQYRRSLTISTITPPASPGVQRKNLRSLSNL